MYNRENLCVKQSFGMRRDMAYSNDEAEAVSLCVSNYHLEDEKDMPVSFSVLPVQWGDSENSDDANKEQVFLHGLADNGPQKIFMQVMGWRFDLSNAKPEISLLSKDRKWIKLQKPRKSFMDTIRTILVTIHFLHRVKLNPQTSAKSVWDNLCKNKELSSYGFKPSQNDISEHMPLIGEAAKRDAALSKSKQFLLLVLEKKLGIQKLSNEKVKDLAQPQCIVDDNDNDMIDEPSEESEAEEDLLDSVCALCDNGGKLLCCDGACMRSFHATGEDGRDSNCDSLGFTRKEVNVIQSFYCKNCKYNQHQCFACGKLGSSDKVKCEVTKCSSATCGRFYHPRCVAKLLPMVVKSKHVGEEFEKNIADGHPFICPVHYCCVCKELENKMEPELQMAVCRRCPKSYHRKCLPRQISFDDEDNLPRAWEGLLSNNRILIYCLNHEIADELGTPKRDHLKFPNVKGTVPEINGADERTKPADKGRVILKENNVGKDKGPNLIGRLSSGELSKKNKSKSNEMNKGYERIKPVNQVDNETPLVEPIRKLSCSLPLSDADSKKSLLALFKEVRSSVTLESVKHKLASTHTHAFRNVLEETITMEKLEGSVDAARTPLRKLESECSIQDVEAVCDPDVLKHTIDHTIDRNKGNNLMLNHDLLKSTNDQEVQASINEGQKRSSHHGNVNQERQQGQKCRMSKSHKTSRKRKHIRENETRGQGVGSPAKRQAVNEMTEGVPDHSQPILIDERSPVADHSQPILIDERSPVEGFQPKSDMASPQVEVGDDNYQLVPVSDVVKNNSGITNNRSGTSERIVPQPGHRCVLKGFASGPHVEYSRRHSAGWLEE
ncbi:protein ENHANCED DOWNY MILDEW 2-like [Gastrolobium bilobum]|uniref:protein ENHANCED DOWNY MILDEW 2-like n=1 Tax=Gastrolobium bilobum TaxID=150636 RepID=UPI002AB1A6A3|nr:protein ENHANCED DOWNY MILDEW 2-like [Gastrolobium bilobum]